ncbi:hypothetical protein [Candidatus Bealeia paramacronuclearis]|uniref:hypothetical protein n=1 Tax=Candidatus Bealeia paramacronuclearis TaxID=1921001 RepID=UPI0030D4088D
MLGAAQAKVLRGDPGQKRERASIIGGLMKGAFVAPFTFFKGMSCRSFFNAWLE